MADWFNNDLSDYIDKKEKVIVEKHKSWRSAKNYLEIAKSINKDMYCILAPAEDTTFLYAYGKIENSFSTFFLFNKT